jgi:hypothetical protein
MTVREGCITWQRDAVSSRVRAQDEAVAAVTCHMSRAPTWTVEKAAEQPNRSPSRHASLPDCNGERETFVMNTGGAEK